MKFGIRTGRPTPSGAMRPLLSPRMTGGRPVIARLTVIAMMMVAALHGGPHPATAQTATAASEQPSTQRAVIRFVTADDFPPFNSLDEDAVLTGLNVDLARAICLDLATTCDIQVRPWEALLGDVAGGKADAAIAAHRVTAAALRQVAFTNRYFFTPARFVVRRDAANLAATPDGLDGRRAGVVAGSPHEAYLQRFFRNTRLKPFNTPELARQALQNQEIDTIFDDGISLAFWANGSLSQGCCRLLDGAYFEAAYFGDGLAIAVNPRDRELLAQLNAALKRVKASGRLSELVERYFPIKVY